MRLFRSVMPGASGVVLASPRGRALAHDVDVEADPDALAAAAASADPTAARECASTLLETREGMFLVVFVPDRFVAEMAHGHAPHREALSQGEAAAPPRLAA